MVLRRCFVLAQAALLLLSSLFGMFALGCTSSAVVGRAPGGAEVIRIPLRLSNVHVVKTRRPVLIDSGTIGDMDDLLKGLIDYGVSPRSLGLVVLTHGHADHSGLRR